MSSIYARDEFLLSCENPPLWHTQCIQPDSSPGIYLLLGPEEPLSVPTVWAGERGRKQEWEAVPAGEGRTDQEWVRRGGREQARGWGAQGVEARKGSLVLNLSLGLRNESREWKERQEKCRTVRDKNEELGCRKLRLGTADSQRRDSFVMKCSCGIEGLDDWDCQCEQNHPDSYQTD